MKLEVIIWEEFENVWLLNVILNFYFGRKDFLELDFIFIFCNLLMIEYWFFLVVFFKNYFIVVLDSVVGDYVKFSGGVVMKKMF